jgi:hypothetical protein
MSVRGGFYRGVERAVSFYRANANGFKNLVNGSANEHRHAIG